MGQHSIDHHETRNAATVLRSEGVADHVADVVGDESRALDFEGIEDAGNVAALRFLVVAAGRLGREPHSAQVGNNHRVVGRQVLGKRHPHVAGLAISVQQHHCWTRAADTHIKLRPIRRDVSRAERLGVGEGRRTRDPFNFPRHDQTVSRNTRAADWRDEGAAAQA
jgi:hypothetical protein